MVFFFFLGFLVDEPEEPEVVETVLGGVGFFAEVAGAVVGPLGLL